MRYVRLINECRRQVAYLWGQKHVITPRLIDWIHGDGLRVIYFSPLNTRPNVYIVRIDSRIEIHNQSAEDVCFAEQVLDDLYDAIEYEYGPKDWTDDRGKERSAGFPALDADSGCEWGNVGFLRRPDKRSEVQIRKAIARKKARV